MNPVKVKHVCIGEGMPKICVPIVEETREAILATAKRILNEPADLIEWRADWYESVFEIEEVLSVLRELREVLADKPILFTFRTKAEGGKKEISYEQYVELLQAVANTGFLDMIDVEVYFNHGIAELVLELQKMGAIVVGSNHDFVKTPGKAELIKRLCFMQSIGVDIPKIAVMPQCAKDVLVLLEATVEMSSTHADRPIVTMSMSGVGTVSRIAGEGFGSAITFGALEKASAPGQIPVKELKKILEIMHIES